ncbi:glucosamine inositolphosphorylceramide transferase family protein [Pseudaminobacter soli (ex Li et al. 2025)]|uniref:Glucosamine inositolphosphorylceramide transferase 1 N-terminal domain-containing protein n=1 Tax=Pseudaminobacter soli (ex Li et al. 2025) TaxID=1295366 RepID=A0A2P7S9A7_9HYPH|nr:hypothetical protein [Mesorhizobium soli]PSJ58895.1 hypothetical protein C7I85_18225 [Mesorhizobium soli]
MSAIDVLVPANAVCHLHAVVADRLRENGHDVALVGVDTPAISPALKNILCFERTVLRVRLNSLLETLPAPVLSPARPDAALRVDLTGGGQQFVSPVLAPSFNGCPSLSKAARLLMLGQLPDVDIVLDGAKPVAHAAPMVDSRISIVRGIEDVLARMVTLLVDTAHRYLNGEPGGRVSVGPPSEGDCPTSCQMIGAYVFSVVPRQVAGAAKRLAYNLHRWNVSYRFHRGKRVADTGLLAGEPWITLPDDGNRFYADPFPFEWQGRRFIFVEDFLHGGDKAVISVAEVFGDGSATVPRCVLEEPYHLSYPQVFSHDGEIWMLPEGGAGGNLVLYRAEAFPDRWERHEVLISEWELYDATVLEHSDRLWLFATQRDGYGSASDTLVVFHAKSLQGPWLPHPANPVRINRAAARPGGRFVRVGDRIVLPLQDGTGEYGGALGLADLVELDETKVRLTIPVPILSPDKSTYSKVHTLNSSEHLEVIDCISPVLRGGLRRARR